MVARPAFGTKGVPVGRKRQGKMRAFRFGVSLVNCDGGIDMTRDAGLDLMKGRGRRRGWGGPNEGRVVPVLRLL